MADVVLNFSDLRDQISFYNVTPTSDGAGGYTTTSAKAFDILAKIKPNGRAKFDGNGIQIFQEVIDVWIRKETGFIPTETMTVQFGGDNYRILFIEDIENRGKVLKLRIATK